MVEQTPTGLQQAVQAPRVDVDLLGSDGSKTQGGFMASWTSPDIVLNLPGLNKIVVIGDVQTCKNAFGAAGGGGSLYFTPSIDIITGPVFFFDGKTTTQLQGPLIGATQNSSWLWTVQLDIDFDLRPAKPAQTPAGPTAETAKS